MSQTTLGLHLNAMSMLIIGALHMLKRGRRIKFVWLNLATQSPLADKVHSTKFIALGKNFVSKWTVSSIYDSYSSIWRAINIMLITCVFVSMNMVDVL